MTMTLERPAVGPSQVRIHPLSPVAVAHDSLGELVDAAVAARRSEAMLQAARYVLVHIGVQYALRHADAFTPASLPPARRLEMARRSVIAEFATALRMSERTMAALAEEAGALCTRLPHTLHALQLGEIDTAHVRVIVGATVDLPDGDPLIGKLDDALAERARETNPASLRRTARRLREELRAESFAERHAKALAERRVELEPCGDGMAWLHLYLEASEAALAHDRLNQIAAAVSRDPGPEERTPEQLRADVARDLLIEAVPPEGSPHRGAASSVRPTVHVTVPVLTLIGGSDSPALIDGCGPIAAETARELAARAPSFTRLLTHPVSGAVLDVDRTVYRPPADLSKWLRVRDETCRFPGCNRRASGCELDHTEGFAAGGKTSFDNLGHLCSKHHHVKHESTWQVRHREGGIFDWISPTGRRHRTLPPGATAAPAGAPPGLMAEREFRSLPPDEPPW
ncbi:HNH endonuclease signature motif containing protein [Agromyces archimandritae]|uniref:DUF222 domain-containing protein n=1 Tax=Agromyces archimandritae TaxID=2781962 RepID=A0A975FMC9_9MICO|nr:HNH endonuclease signature motif containing protein [Agromyces archimandritae]QTX04138.1 DUF222 domain-containing protein [Agromyces archimandritae]